MKRACLLLLFAGCTLAPKYERPSLSDMPSVWMTALSTENSQEIDWWKQFGDPVLDSLIEQALAQNQDLKAAIARVDEFQAQLTMARSKLYPQLSGDAFASKQKISTSVSALPPGIKQIFNLFGGILNASYLVDLWGEVRSGAEAAYHAWLSSVEARKMVVLALVSGTASAYFQLRQFDSQLAIAYETLQTRNESLYLAQVRFGLGLNSELEVQQAIAEVESAKVEIDTLQIEQALAQNLLCFLIGAPSQPLERGLSLDEALMPPSIPETLPSDLLLQRPDVRAAEEKLIAANANIGAARAKFLPQINLASSLGTESTQVNTLFQNASKIWEFGADAIQQIFTGFALTGQLELSYAQKEELLHAYLSTILKAIQEANDALASHRLYLEEVENQKARAAAQKQYLYLSDLRYKEGQIDYLTFLDAERQLFRGLLDLETAKGNSFLSYIQIYQAFGGCWVEAADNRACP